MRYFEVGSLTFACNSISRHEMLTNFYRLEKDGNDADFFWDIEEVTSRQWPLSVPSGTNGIWSIGREKHQLIYNSLEKKVILKILPTFNSVDKYWLKRDLFGCFASISGELAIHSSAVISNELGYIFCAASETGKSTLYNNLRGYCELVNDESNWVFERNGKLHLVNQNYYFGESDTKDVRIGEIFILRRGLKSKIVGDVDKVEAYLLLLAVHAPFDNFDPFLELRSKYTVKFLSNHNLNYFYASLDRAELRSLICG